MRTRTRRARWLPLVAVLLVLGALLLQPVYAGGEDDPSVGGPCGGTESAGTTLPEPPTGLPDFLLQWWLALGLLLP